MNISYFLWILIILFANCLTKYDMPIYIPLFITSTIDNDYCSKRVELEKAYSKKEQVPSTRAFQGAIKHIIIFLFFFLLILTNMSIFLMVTNVLISAPSGNQNCVAMKHNKSCGVCVHW